MTALEATAGGTSARFEARAMGSPLRLTLGRAPVSPTVAGLCWNAVVDEFGCAEAAMSRFRDSSELTALNRAAGNGTTAYPSDRLRRALIAADRAHRITGGRFDPRVLMDLDRLGYRGAALERMGTIAPGDDVRSLDRRVVEGAGRGGLTIRRPIDLGGIGKGLALRWAAVLLERRGARDFLLEAGGDLVARGRDPEGAAWQVGIEDPTGSDDLAVITVSDLAVATSSVRVHRWRVGGDTDGRMVHHLLDPRTGEPGGRGLVAVTVAGPDTAWAEVWSKVLFLAGREAIADEARSRGLAAWWVSEDGGLEMTAAARSRTIWVAAESG